MNGDTNIKKHRTWRFPLALVLFALGLFCFMRVISSQRRILEIYRSGSDGKGRVFCHRLVREISFKDYYSRVNLIVDSYNRSFFPPPEKFPPHTIEWKGVLNAPFTGEYRFHIESDAPVKLRVGDTVVLDKSGEGSISLTSGSYGFSLFYANEGKSYKGFPHGGLEVVAIDGGQRRTHPLPLEEFAQTVEVGMPLGQHLVGGATVAKLILDLLMLLVPVVAECFAIDVEGFDQAPVF